jgi:hypothetical protein
MFSRLFRPSLSQEDNTRTAESTAELDALCERMVFLEEQNNALVKSLGEAEDVQKDLQDLHAKMQLETTAALQELHEKLQLKQQNYEREQKNHADMMGKLLEKVEKTSLLAAQDLEQSKETPRTYTRRFRIH